jgi:hypothetical protein
VGWQEAEAAQTVAAHWQIDSAFSLAGHIELDPISAIIGGD